MFQCKLDGSSHQSSLSGSSRSITLFISPSFVISANLSFRGIQDECMFSKGFNRADIHLRFPHTNLAAHQCISLFVLELWPKLLEVCQDLKQMLQINQSITSQSVNQSSNLSLSFSPTLPPCPPVPRPYTHRVVTHL